ncbi:MAG: transglycosylase domain-containing protein [Oscillospiraceae bacterium]
MSTRRKRAVAKAAKKGASGIGHILLLILKAIGILMLIGITTGAIFACIFVIYIKTNLVSSDLDVTLEDLTLSQTSIIYYYDKDTGKYEELVSLQGAEDRIWVDYEDIPLDLEHAVVAIEDQRFYTHHGVDWFRTSGAFVNMFVGMKNTFGGSTITQQLIKNVTGYDDATVQRKLTEIFRALEFEKKYEKWEIIEGYLNQVYFGHKQYGIGAAAKYYFDKDVSELTLAEMCSIVGITNNPSLYSPKVNPENNKRRQETILDKMLEQGYISQAEHDAAVAEELNFTFNTSGSGSDTEIYTWFEEAVIEDVTNYLAESRGVSARTARQLLLNGGYRIYATIDVDIQACVDEIYQDLEQIPKASGSNQQFQSAIVITDPYTGDIVAMAGGVGEKTANLLNNRATMARRAPGSSIKPISVYAPAMDMGLITPDTVYEDEADIVLDGTDWFPHNDDYKNRGPVTIRQAVVSSLNTIAAQVLDDLTPAASYNFLTTKLGIELDPADMDYAPLAMGQLTYGVTVREMATAYSIFPTNGMFTESRTFSHIYDSEGNLIYENTSDSHAVISESTAYWMTSILNDAATSGTGASANLGFMPTAGKTGTSGSSKDRWFVGFTPYYVAAVWTGYDTPATISVSGNPAAQLWKKVMTLVHEDLEYKSFSTPENTYQEPVEGVEVVTYYIRGIAVDDVGGVSILYEEAAGERAVGREVTVTAKSLDGYDIVGSAEATITLTSAPEDNVIEFRYVSNVPVEPDPPEPDEPDPDNPDTPDNPGGSTEPPVPDEPDHGENGDGSEDGGGTPPEEGGFPGLGGLVGF